ncbi:ankyrin repeat and SOCS box protein 3-like [Apteryx rowi]|uniref:ankyrin repeat and SOCS box protein 3-like n=1 Tax=Apteryx rowi TaxID=308060 RepID=UPI000E1C95D1|nr:ankyrin repeat and SOCS box protein 3-like [Apteryx rowi]
MCCSLYAVHRFFDLIDVLLNYGITLLGINLGYCLYHGKFPLFRRFLKLGCWLPSEDQLPEFVSYAVKAHEQYKEWLPYLLLAGFNPLNLLCKLWIYSVNEDALNFVLEFTNWKRLPPAVERNLSDYKESSTWIPNSHFGKQHHWRKKNPLCIPVPRMEVGNGSLC